MEHEVDSKILERIKKLHAMAVSAQTIGSHEEAASFAAAVQQLLDKHDLEMSDVEFALALVNDPVKMSIIMPEAFGESSLKRSRNMAQRVIAVSLAQLYHCELIGDADTPRAFWIIGRREHRQVAAFMITALLRTMMTMSERHYVQFFHHCRNMGDVTKARGFKAGFIDGYAVTIGLRVQAALKDRNQPGVGLVRFNQEKAKINAFMAELERGKAIVKGAKMPAGRAGSRAGQRVGEQVGQRVSLTASALPEAQNAPAKQLGAGQ